MQEELQLFETILWSKGSGFFLLDEHLRRLQNGARFFKFSVDLEKVIIELENKSEGFSTENQRVRLVLEKDGRISVLATPWELPPFLTLPLAEDALQRPAVQRIRFADAPVSDSGPFRSYKTTCRPEYDSEYRRVVKRGELDAIFCNVRGEVTEGCISNIIILKDGIYFTPPLSCGILPGVMRAQLLARSQSSPPLLEQVLTRGDVEKADAVFICNSVRGVVRVTLMTPDKTQSPAL
ncbi:aminotransferase class IV [Desulforhopalus sp. IMCC35007]|uniref:aminotransferase class IV n=1 Tax=Desulforhopalus sp. IMCC35007 TaxID=2569543 RepID=UPI00145EF307|nr:aminotransferase class IV [Desulforhopalus sp. IMCC35007]